MGVKKWPGPLNRVIKCRYFKQQSELECASELYLHEDTSSKLTWKLLGNCFLADILCSFSSLNGGARNNERGVVHDMTFKERIFSFFFRPGKWVERVASS